MLIIVDVSADIDVRMLALGRHYPRGTGTKFRFPSVKHSQRMQIAAQESS
jgi:hypothetical protein